MPVNFALDKPHRGAIKKAIMLTLCEGNKEVALQVSQKQGRRGRVKEQGRIAAQLQVNCKQGVRRKIDKGWILHWYSQNSHC
ncbi:hypothetical protein P3S68_012595 [Capsicum galapagoense]